MTRVLRRATPADLDAIMELETATFTDDAWSGEQMASELAGPHRHYLVAEDPAAGPGLLGYAGLLAPRGSGQADIQTIAVVPGARRSGLGRTLLLALIAEARSRDAEHVFLEVRADNPGAESLYALTGFERIGIRPRYYRGGVDAVLMRLALEAPRVRPAVGPVGS